MIWLILLFAFVLRLISLNQSLWLDEATTALVSKMPIVDIFTKFLPADFHPPFYYLLMKGWVSIFGSSEISLRIPSIIFGVATIYFTYLIAKKLFNEKIANITSILSATSGLFVYYSQEARMYALAALLVSILFYLFIEKKWVVFSLVLPLLAMTDYVALLILPVFLIFAGKDLKKLLLSLIPMSLVFALWSPVFLKQISAGTGVVGTNWGNILGTLTWKNLTLIPVKFIIGRIGFDNRILYAFIAGSGVLLYGYLILMGSKSILRRPLNGYPLKLILGWLVMPIILGILVSIRIPILHYFRFIFCLPAFYILVAKGIDGFKGTWFGTFIAATMFINIFSTGIYLLDTRFQRENWRNIALVIGNDKVIFLANSQREALTYYGKDNQIIYYKNFDEDKPQIWLSRYVWSIFDPTDAARAKIEDLGYNKDQELNLNGVEFWRYIKQ